MVNAITLTPPEQLFRRCLLNCRSHMKDVPGMKDLELRWTGGWVRDKLLGVQSHDIDVALSTLTGWQFGQALQAYMKDNASQYEAEAEQQGFKAELRSLAKIAANPERSKHLETITTRMFGIDVDFVNLRKEVYDEKSRNPQMEFGTPEEDALRRDACVNALFYNLDTQQVEDFTQRGLDDMQNQLIRTPLAAYQTFKEDPLRVLRLIRFAARLGYTIDPEAQEAMRNSEIHDTLRLKISRERVGVEIEKIMNGPDALRGMSLIYQTDLYSTVFGDPDSDQSVSADEFSKVIESANKILNNKDSIHEILKPSDNLTSFWILAAYVPYRESGLSAVTAARNGIKATNVVCTQLNDSLRYQAEIHGIVSKVNKDQASRSDVGMLLRKFGKSWTWHVVYCLLGDTIDKGHDDAVKSYTALVGFIKDNNLQDAATMKPILNGNQVQKLLEIQRPGSWLKDALDVLVEWQFTNPKASKSKAEVFIISKKDQLSPR